MFMKMNSAALGAALILFAGTVAANATAVSYANFALWSAAASGSSPVTILEPIPNVVDPDNPPNLLPGVQYFGSGTASASYGGVLFQTNGALSDGHFFNVGSDFSGSLPVLSSQAQSFGVANILITLAAPVKAFALNFDTYDGHDDGIANGAAVSFTLSNGHTLPPLDSMGNAYDLASFFGVVDDTPFKWILLTSSDPALNINKLNIGAAVAPIPEPATWIMLLLGFAGIGLFGGRLSARRAPAR
jgi:hypothetical protein